MANTILSPTIITREALRILHANLNFIGSINRQYDKQFANEGASQYEKVVDACGGVGIRVNTPRELPATIKRALTIAREQRTQVLLNVCLHSSSR